MPASPTASPSVAKGSSSNEDSKASRDAELAPYIIASEIGKGSFATVYRGFHTDTREEIAIKAVKTDILKGKMIDNLQSEIEILKQLSHRHITKLIDIIRADSQIYLIMEYCSGGDLSQYIKRRGRVESLSYIPGPGQAPIYYPHPKTGGLEEKVVRSFLRQLARALKFLRHRNLIHRDIKPQNLLLTPAAPEHLAKGHPLGVPILKVADFGFARSLPASMMAETLCGSPLYMAPEILGYKKYDAKADLWSVGAVLYEMAVGKPPFRANNPMALLKRIKATTVIQFPDEDPANATVDVLPVPSDIKKLIRGLLKKEPTDRASYEDFFGSTAVSKSRNPRPDPLEEEPVSNPNDIDEEQRRVAGRPNAPTQLPVPETHKVIPPEVLDPKILLPPSKFHFRPRSGSKTSKASSDGPDNGQNRVGGDEHPLLDRAPSLKTKDPPEHSVIPGETEEEGLVRREYVLVGDTRAVNFDRAVEELKGGRRPIENRDVPITPLVDQMAGHEYAFGPSCASPRNVAFPPPPNTARNGSSPWEAGTLTRQISNPLARALNVASKKLFGARPILRQAYPPSRSSPSSSPRLLGAVFEDDEEEELLSNLEDLAQKAHVLERWSTEMYESVRAAPRKPLSDPEQFTVMRGESERDAEKRKRGEIEAHFNAHICISLSILLMSFSQRGIDRLRKHRDSMRIQHPEEQWEPSEGFEDALHWFKDQFIRSNERAMQVRMWVSAAYVQQTVLLEQLLYDRALQFSKVAARKELLDQAKSPDECEQLYEESLWCLYALQDDLTQESNPFREEDRTTIATWITRTKLRLVRCQARKNMEDRARLRDARADQNLDDVTRIPHPWEVKHTPPQQTPPRSL